MIDSVDKLYKKIEELNQAPKAVSSVLVSLGTCGLAAGGSPVYEALKTEIADKKLEHVFNLVQTGCMGMCHSEPSIEIIHHGTGERVFYGNVTPDNAAAIIGAKQGIATGIPILSAVGTAQKMKNVFLTNRSKRGLFCVIVDASILNRLMNIWLLGATLHWRKS